MAQHSTNVTSQGLGGAFGNFFRETSEDVEGLGRGTAAIPGIVSEYAQETTAAEKAEDVVGFGKGMVEAIAEDPLTFIAESLPIYGQYAAVRDSNMMLDAAKEARERGDEESAINMEALAATAMLGAIPIIGGGLRAGSRGARRAGGLETLRTGPEIEQPLSDETYPGIASIEPGEQDNVVGGATPDPLANIRLSAADRAYIGGFNEDEIVPGRAFESGIPSSGILGAIQKKQSKKGLRMTLDNFDSFVENYQVEGAGLSRNEINDLKAAARQSTTLSNKGKKVVDSFKLAEVLPALDTSNRLWVSAKSNHGPRSFDLYDNSELAFAEKAHRAVMGGQARDEQRVVTLNVASPVDMAQGITATARISSNDQEIFAVNNALHSRLQNILNEPDLYGQMTTDQIMDEFRSSDMGLPAHYRNFVKDTLDDADSDIREAIDDLLGRTRYMQFLTRTGREKVLKDLPDDEARRARLDEAYLGDAGFGPNIAYADSMNFLTQDTNLGAGSNDPLMQVDPTQVLTLPEDLAVMMKFADHQSIQSMKEFVDTTLDELNQFENSNAPNVEQVRQDNAYYQRPRYSYEEFKGRFDRELERLQAEENSTGKVQSYDLDNLVTLPDPVSRVMDRWDEVQINSRGYDDVAIYDPVQSRYGFQTNVDYIADVYRDRARAEERENPILQATGIRARVHRDNHENFRTLDDWSSKNFPGFGRSEPIQIVFQPNKTYAPEDIGKDVLINRTIAEQAINQPAAPWAGVVNASVLDGKQTIELQNDLRGKSFKENFGTVKDGKVMRASNDFVRKMDFVTDPSDTANYLQALNELPKATEAQALLSPDLLALKNLISPHRYTENRRDDGVIITNLYKDLINDLKDSPDVNISSLLKEIDNDNAEGKGQSPYFKDIRAIREGLKAIDEIRNKDTGLIEEGAVTPEFFDEHLTKGAPFREAMNRIVDLYPSLNTSRDARNFVTTYVRDPNSPNTEIENPIGYFIDERLNQNVRIDNSLSNVRVPIGAKLGVMYANAPDSATPGQFRADLNNNYRMEKGPENQLHEYTFAEGYEVSEPFENYSRDAVGTQKKLIKAMIVDAIRQGNNAITLPGVITKDNPEFDVNLPEDGGINPKKVVDRATMEDQPTRHMAASGMEQDKPQVYASMWTTATSLVDEINADLKKTGKPGKFTAVLAPTGRLDGKLTMDQSETGINIPMRIRPVIYWTPDTQEKLKFRKGGLVTLPGKRYEPGIEAVIRKYRREGMMD